jgi:hypothetical protein
MKNKMVLITNKHGFQTLQIDDEKFDSTPDLIFDLPQKLIGEINIKEFPIGITIRPYVREDSSEYFYNRFPIIIKNIGNGMISLEIEACRENKFAEYPIGIGCFQLIKVEYILTQKAVNPGITNFDNDGSFVHLHYSIELPVDTVDNLIEAGMKFDEDVTVRILDLMKKSENDIRQNLGLTLL